MIFVDNDELAALELLKDADKVSFTDCVSFALMRRAGLRQAYTFDHFRRAGFEVRP